MKKNRVLFILLMLFLSSASSSYAQCGVNFLNNGGFDSPAQSTDGSNFTASNSFNGWTMTGGKINIVRVNGTSSSGPGPSLAQDGNQFLNIYGGIAGTVYQDFTIPGFSRPVVFGGYFSSHEVSGYINWTAKVEIYAMPANTLVSTSTTRLFTSVDGNAGQGTWYLMYGSATLTPGAYRYVASLGSFGNFDAAFINIGCVVPVTLKSFEGQNIDSDIRLNWTLEDQEELSHFEIEKSNDGFNFKKIKEINPSTGNAYYYTDKDADTASFVYYRLRMVGINNKVSYSNIIRLNVIRENNFQVAPNVASDNMSLSGMKGNGWICIFDVSGKKILSKEIKSETLDVNVSSLPHGMYLVQYSDGTMQQTRKFFKQ